MRRVLHDASAVIMNTPEAAKRARTAFPDLDPSRLWAIPNGFNGAEFPPGDVARNDVFRIVHTGSLHTQLGLRHRRTRRVRKYLGGLLVHDVDFLTRSHVFLLQAVDRLLRADPSLAGGIEVHLVGPLTDADREVAQSSPAVHLHEYLPHDEATQMMRTADLLFLPMHDLPSSVRAGLVPTKTYEYAASRRPILAAVPEGDARDFLRELGTATIVDPTDIAGMERAIAAAHKRWREGGDPPQVNEAVLSRFEYGEIVRQISQVLDVIATG